MREELYLLALIFAAQGACLVELVRMRKEIWMIDSSVSKIQTQVEWYVGRAQNPQDPRYKVPPPRTARM